MKFRTLVLRGTIAALALRDFRSQPRSIRGGAQNCARKRMGR